MKEQVAAPVTRPIVRFDCQDVYQSTITICDIDPPAILNCHHTSIERIIHHIKDAFGNGTQSLNTYYTHASKDPFAIGMSYVFHYIEADRALQIQIFPSLARMLRLVNVRKLAKRSKADIEDIRQEVKSHAFKTLDDDNYLVSYPMESAQQLQAVFYFTMTCVERLQNFFNMVYADACNNHCTPNYYQFGVDNDQS